MNLSHTHTHAKTINRYSRNKHPLQMLKWIAKWPIKIDKFSELGFLLINCLTKYFMCHLKSVYFNRVLKTMLSAEKVSVFANVWCLYATEQASNNLSLSLPLFVCVCTIELNNRVAVFFKELIRFFVSIYFPSVLNFIKCV